MNQYLPTAFIAIAGLVCLVILLRWQRSHPNFDLSDLVTGDNGRVSLSKIGQASALAVSTWGFIVLVEQGKLTEFYFIGYMVAWSATRLTNQYLDRGTPASREKSGA